jgi:hypothetical protein
VLAVRLKLDVEQVRILGRDMLLSTLRRALFKRLKRIGETDGAVPKWSEDGQAETGRR